MEQLFDLALINSALRVLTPILLAALGGALLARRIVQCRPGRLYAAGCVLRSGWELLLRQRVLCDIVCDCDCIDLFVDICLFEHKPAGERHRRRDRHECAGGRAYHVQPAGDLRCKGRLYDNTMVGLPKWNIPVIEDIPVIGPILAGLTPLVYLSFLIAGLMWYYFYRTKSGFRFLAAGENPLAAKSVGIRVARYQYGAVLASGVLCALAGAQLSLGQVTMFTEGMTAGRGFIALVATMLGQSGPLGVTAASLLFGFMDALSIRFQGLALPTHFTQMLPYVVTILAMFFFKDKSFQKDALKQGSSSR